MKLEVANIHSSVANSEPNSKEFIYGPADIIVVLSNNKKYLASFLSFRYLEEMFRKKLEGENSHPDLFFWSKSIVVVKNCRIETIERVVDHLLEEGEFLEVFKML